jgi:hypothetical protein
MTLELENLADGVRQPAVARLMWQLRIDEIAKKNSEAPESTEGNKEAETIGAFRIGSSSPNSETFDDERGQRQRAQIARTAVRFRRFVARAKKKLPFKR